MNSNKSTASSSLVWKYLVVLDLKMSCRALSASVRWTKTICRVRSRGNRLESVILNFGWVDAVSGDKISASVPH